MHSRHAEGWHGHALKDSVENTLVRVWECLASHDKTVRSCWLTAAITSALLVKWHSRWSRFQVRHLRTPDAYTQVYLLYDLRC